MSLKAFIKPIIEIIFVATIILWCSLGYSQQQESLQYVKSEYISLPLEIQFDGVVQAIQKGTLSAQVSGRIEAINFDVGDFVEQGNVIARIRSKEYEARLIKAKAGLSGAKSGFIEAQLEFERIEDLYKRKLISKSDYDKASSNLNVKSALVDASQASIVVLQEQLDNTIVRAPYSGVVLERYIEEAETIQVGQKIMSGYTQGRLRVEVDVPQSIINAVRKEQNARVLLLGQKDSIGVAKMTIFPYANPENHSFHLRLNLDVTDQPIFPGMMVKVAFITGHISRLLVPQNTLVYRSEVVGVYVVNQQHQVSFRQVRPGQVIGNKIEILAGLEADENVALNPVNAGIALKAQLGSK